MRLLHTAGLRPYRQLLFVLLVLALLSVPGAQAATTVIYGGSVADAIGAYSTTTEHHLGNGAWGSVVGDAKIELYIVPILPPFSSELGSFTIGDIQRISYWTKNDGLQGGVDFYINIYTDPYPGGDASWYGNRLTMEPLYANNYSAPGNQWNQWNTDPGTNQLTFFDSNHGPTGFYGAPTLTDIQAGPIRWSDWTPTGDTTPIDYASQTVKYIVLATGNPWASNFEGLVDELTIELKNGGSVTLDLEGKPDEVWVDDDWMGTMPGEDPDGPGPATSFGYDAFATVQDGVNGVAGSTVHVAAGTYVEQVVINKDLTLEGTGSPVIQAPVSPKAFKFPESSAWWEPVLIAFGGSESGGQITGTGQVTVSISGLVVDGNDRAPTSGRRSAGVLGRNILGDISDNTVQHMYVDGAQTFGIIVYGDSDVTIAGNDVSGYARGGIAANGDLGPLPDPHAIIHNNTVTGPGLGVPVTWAPNGIQIGWNATGEIHHNTVSGNGWPGTAWSGSGIIIAASDNVLIAENTVTGNETGIAVVGDNWFGSADIATGTIIRRNTVDGNTYGISMQDRCDGTLVEENFVNNSTYDGVDVAAFYGVPPTNTHIFNNDLSGNNTAADPTSGGLWIDASAATVDASGNWWGSNDPATVPTFIIGDGDYTPWLDSGADTDAGTPGFQGDFSALHVDDDSPQTGTTGIVQEGVDMAVGSTVYVEAGVYEEQVSIDKDNLTLEGRGVGTTILRAPVTMVSLFNTGNPNKPIVYVHDADGVTIREMTVDGAGRGNGNYRIEGIAFYNAGGTVENTAITAIRETPLSGNQHGVALYAYNADDTPRTLNVLNNTIDDYQKNGMALNGSNLTVNVTGNTVTGAGPSNKIAQNGIQVGWGAAGVIDGNTVANHSWTGGGWVATDILIYTGDVDITNNTLSEGQVGVYYLDGSGVVNDNTLTASAAGLGVPDFWGIVVSDPPDRLPSPFDAGESGGQGSSGRGPRRAPGSQARTADVMTVQVNGNTLTGDGSGGSYGLEVDAGYGSKDIHFSAAGNTISQWGTGLTVYTCSGASWCTPAVFQSAFIGPDNDIFDIEGEGIAVYNTDDVVTISDNNLHDNDTGISFYASNGNLVTGNLVFNNRSNGLTIQDETSTGTTTHDNQFCGNGVYGAENKGTTTTDAENNWWGASDGPAPTGSGDAISVGVDADPWLTLPPGSGPCAATVNLTKFLDADEDGLQDPDEDGLEGWTFTVYSDPDHQNVVTSGQTGSDGSLTFYLPAGDYEVCETLQPGWLNTTDLCQPVTTALNQTVDLAFGNVPPGSITIVKEASINHDWDFTGDLGDFTLPSGGSQAFSPLAAGTYAVAEETASFPKFWTLLSVSCYVANDGSWFYPTINDYGQTIGVDIPLQPGQDITCTFLNERAGFEPDASFQIFLPLVVK